MTACDVLKLNKRSTSKDLPPPFADSSANDAKNAASSHKIQSPQISIEKVRDLANNAPRDSQITINNTQNQALADLSPASDNNLSGSDLAKPSGLKINKLFADGTKDTNARFERLENVVQSMASDFKQLKPSIERLVTIESDLENITFQLENLLKQEDVIDSDTMAPKPMMVMPDQSPSMLSTKIENTKSKAKKPYKTPKSYIKSGDLIHTMRVADHAGKTRVVFETTEKLDYEVTIDNDENLITIQFKNGSLGSDPNTLRRFSKLFKSIAEIKEGNGSLIIFELTKDSEIITKQRIKPGKNNVRHRIFIDFKS